MPTPGYPSELAEAATHAASQASARWVAAASTPRRGGRVVMAACLAWNAAYPIAYKHGYRTLVDGAIEAFTELQQRSRGDPTTAPHDALCELVGIAQRVCPVTDAQSPIPREVLELATMAALDRPEDQTAPEAIAKAVHQEAVRCGTLQGVLAGAADITINWRARVDPALLAGRSLLAECVNATLGQLNRHVVTTLLLGTGRGAPQLARSNFAVPVATIGGGPAGLVGEQAAIDRARSRSRP